MSALEQLISAVVLVIDTRSWNLLAKMARSAPMRRPAAVERWRLFGDETRVCGRAGRASSTFGKETDEIDDTCERTVEIEAPTAAESHQGNFHTEQSHAADQRLRWLSLRNECASVTASEANRTTHP